MPCPHKRIAECPLFVASHDARFAGVGCVDDLAQPCRVDRGRAYQAQLDAAIKRAFRLARAKLLPEAA